MKCKRIHGLRVGLGTKRLVLLFLLASPSLARAAAVYADGSLSANCTSGKYSIANRTCTGSDGNGYKTIQAAVSTLTPGDTLYVRAGTYNERITINVSGSNGAYITIRNYSTEAAVLSGAGLDYGNMIFALNRSYIIIQGLEISTYDGPGILFAGACHYIKILDNYLHDQSANTAPYGHAILVTSLDWPYCRSASNITISGNHLKNIVTGIPSAVMEALTVAFDVSYVVITYNTLEDIAFIGINHIGYSRQALINYLAPYGGDGSVPATPWVRNFYTAYNTVKNSGWGQAEVPCAALYVDGAQNGTIEHNLLYHNAYYGTAISAEDSTTSASFIILRYNVAYDNLDTQLGFGDFSVPNSPSTYFRMVHNTTWANKFWEGHTYASVKLGEGDDIVVKNNIFMNMTAPNFHLMHYSGASYRPTLDYNNYYPNTSYFDYHGVSYVTPPTWSSYLAGSGQDAHSITTDPLFVDAPRDFRLQAGSPAIDAGAFLTTTNGSGSNSTSVIVHDAAYFSDGRGVVSGDVIMVGSNSVSVTAVNYSTNTLTVTPAISWSDGTNVSYFYSGRAPDMGAREYGVTRPDFPSSLTIRSITP